MQCFCWKLFWANPGVADGLLEHGTDAGCWLRNAGNVTGMFSQNGDEGLSQELIPWGGLGDVIAQT